MADDFNGEFAGTPMSIGANGDFIVISTNSRENVMFFPRQMSAAEIAHIAIAHIAINTIADGVFGFLDPDYSSERFEDMLNNNPKETAKTLIKIMAIIGSHYHAATDMAKAITKLKSEPQGEEKGGANGA